MQFPVFSRGVAARGRTQPLYTAITRVFSSPLTSTKIGTLTIRFSLVT